MKKDCLCFLITVLSAVLTTSCSRTYRYPDKLVAADSLCNVRADSAFALLKGMKNEVQTFDDDSRWYYRLLLVKASFKALTPLKSEKEVMEIVRHYEDGGDKRQLPYAYFYAGCTMNKLKDAPQALTLLQKALSVLPEGDLRLESNIYNNSGHIYWKQHMYENAALMQKKSLRIDSIMKDTALVISNLAGLGTVYMKLKENDSSLLFYKKALRLSEIIGNNSLKDNTIEQLAIYYISLNDYKNAEKCMALLSKDTLTDINYTKFAILSRIYTETNRYDSALYFAQKVLSTKSIFNKEESCKDLAKIYFARGNDKKGFEYLDLYYKYSDSVKNATGVEAVAKVNALYNYTIRENENIRLKADNVKKNITIYSSFVTFVAFALFCAVFFIRYKNRQKRRVELINAQKEEIYRNSEEFIKENQKRIRHLEAELENERNRSADKRQELENEKDFLVLTNEMVKNRISQKNLLVAEFKRKETFRLILLCADNGKCIPDDEWTAIEEDFDSTFLGFRHNLIGLHNISRHEYRICILTKLDFSGKEMSLLMSCSDSAISKARKRMAEKIFGTNSKAKDLDRYIKTL